MHHRFQHLGRSDRRLSPLESSEDDSLLQERHVCRAHLHTEVATGDHHRICLVEDLVDRRDGLLELDLRDHPRLRPGELELRPEGGDVCSRADEGLSDVVDSELEREVEVLEILLGERGNRQGHSGNVHALVRLDDAARDHAAQRPIALDPLDAEPYVAVVDQHVLLGS